MELARSPGRRSKLLDARQAAELRATVDALLERAEPWRPPPRGPDDGPPASDELLLIVLRSKRTANTRRLYARELTLFLAFCQRRGQAALWVRGKGETESNQRVPLNAPTAAALERWQPMRAAIAGADEQLLRSATTGRALTRHDPRARRPARARRRRRPAQPARPQGHDGHARARRRHGRSGTSRTPPGTQDPRTTRRYDRDRRSLNRHAALRPAQLGDA